MVEIESSLFRFCRRYYEFLPFNNSNELDVVSAHPKLRFDGFVDSGHPLKIFLSKIKFGCLKNSVLCNMLFLLFIYTFGDNCEIYREDLKYYR